VLACLLVDWNLHAGFRRAFLRRRGRYRFIVEYIRTKTRKAMP